VGGGGPDVTRGPDAPDAEGPRRALGGAARDDPRRRAGPRLRPSRGTFTQFYGGTALDASLLLIPRVGFLPATDPRVHGTIAAIQQDLTVDGFVMRYQTTESDDGLPSGEGLFLACSFWLVDALHLGGRRREATELFERLLDLRNDVGLLSEEWDPVAGRQLGNTPQAFSHFPLVTSGLQLHAGRAHRSDETIRHSQG